MTVMTEDEASGKWCPFTRRIELRNGEILSNGPRGSLCAGSACMAWRWCDGEISRAEYSDAVPAGKNVKDDWKDPRGYCGLAHKP